MRASETDGGGGALEVPEPLWRLEQALRARAERGEVAIPPYPAVALRVQEVMARTHFGLGEVAGLIGADAVLASDILRCANSAMYRRGAPVIDLTQALTRIGVQQVTRLLLASGLASHAQALGPLVSLRRMVWIEGLAGAAVSQELARLRGLRTEDAFTLGLLHDFGKVVAVVGLEKLLEEERIEDRFERAAWEAVVERLHQPLGQVMAARWRLPRLVGEVVAAHHGGGECSDPGLLAAVATSDRVVALLLSRARVGEQDLAAVEGLAPAERGPVAAVLEQVPDFVAAFETPASAAAVPSPRVAPPPVRAAPGRRPVRFGVSVSVARRPRLFSATAIDDGRLLATGDEPLPENRLLEAKLYGPQPFTLWVLSRGCGRDGAAYQVELQPFALSGPAKELWTQLVSADPPQACGSNHPV
jgi:HD-like signal output (HDOD) protein